MRIKKLLVLSVIQYGNEFPVVPVHHRKKMGFQLCVSSNCGQNPNQAPEILMRAMLFSSMK